MIESTEREKLYRQVRVLLATSESTSELTNVQMDDLFDIVISELSSKLNNWLSTQQWGSISGINLSKNELQFYLTTKTLDFENSFTHAYSKQIEMGSGKGFPKEWQLKQDYFIVESGKQVYEVPANREIMSVLWNTPPEIGKAYFGGAYNTIGDPTYAQTALGGTYMSGTLQARTVLPLYGILLAAQSVSLSDQIMKSAMTYKITQGKNGKKHIHLFPVPNSQYEPYSFGVGKHYEGSYVFYWYYDEDIESCPDDVREMMVLTPNQVQLSTMRYSDLNDDYKTRVRRILVAKCKQYIGYKRGKFSGELNFGDATRTMDYRMYAEDGKMEEQKVYEELKEELESYSYDNIMRKRAEIADNLSKILQYQISNDILIVG